MNGDVQDWFTQEILIHQRALVGFVSRVWPTPSEVDDLCQEALVRVYESALKALPVSPRAFLFATVRHLMADRVRRGRVVSIEMKGDLESLNVLIDEVSPERSLSGAQDIWQLAQAFASLSPESQRLIWMIKVEELSHREVAVRLGITPKAVERRLARGIRLLERAYFGPKRPRVVAGNEEEKGADHGES